MRYTASVIIEKTAFSFDKPYDYLIPENLIDRCLAGCRVLVPFGRSNSVRQGLIINVRKTDDIQGLKELISIYDTSPILNDEMRRLCVWLHEKLFCTYFDAVNTVLPAGISLKTVANYSAVDGDFQMDESERKLYEYIKNSRTAPSFDALIKRFGQNSVGFLSSLETMGAVIKADNAVRKIGDATLKSVRIIGDIKNVKLSQKQNAVAQYLTENGEASVKQLQYYTGVTASVIDALVKKGVAEYFRQEVLRSAVASTVPTDNADIILTDEQNTAYTTLQNMMGRGSSALLYGVTGSGKTQVFLKLADKAISNNKGVIIMVPEISLTPQTISVFARRYGGKIAVFHSAMSLGARMDEWKRIKKGEAVIAIGTRSAIFAPMDNIGLIIMDEEQEHTYKSEQSPRFHARDIAIFRNAYHKSLFVMASATPSVETYTAALHGKYTLCTLKNRYGNAVLPEVQIVDMREELLAGNKGAISSVLYKNIENCLTNGEQAIVLLNRRGHHTYISCPSCGTVVTCPNCSVSLTYHSANKRVMCHYCGYSDGVPDKCSECGEERLKFTGIGTQKLEEELSQLFPDARILRLDADSTASKDSYAKYLTDFADGKYDIMLGTQMVAKGLDFPNVTVVGVIGADKGMNSEDYRSVERTFSLLTQVVGRAGRGDKAGKAIIQTQNPDNNIIYLAQNQDYEAFYDSEIKLRQVLTYPPYCDIICVSATSTSQSEAQGIARKVFDNIKALVQTQYMDVKLIVLGPSAALMPKVNNKYKYKLLIKCKNNKRTRELLKTASDVKLKNDAKITIDINPESVI